ncbi:MAG: Wzz/FepE/Etk N-terminal domain-containing protein [Acidimicrobiales bacterium]
MQLRDYLAVLRRRRRWLVLVVVVVMAGTAAWSVLQTPMYRSSAQVLMRSTPTVSGPAGFADTGVLANEVRLATSEEFSSELELRIGYPPDVSVRSESSASVLTRRAATIPTRPPVSPTPTQRSLSSCAGRPTSTTTSTTPRWCRSGCRRSKPSWWRWRLRSWPMSPRWRRTIRRAATRWLRSIRRSDRVWKPSAAGT